MFDMTAKSQYYLDGYLTEGCDSVISALTFHWYADTFPFARPRCYIPKCICCLQSYDQCSAMSGSVRTGL